MFITISLASHTISKGNREGRNRESLLTSQVVRSYPWSLVHGSRCGGKEAAPDLKHVAVTAVSHSYFEFSFF